MVGCSDGRDDGCDDGQMLGWPEGCCDGCPVAQTLQQHTHQWEEK